MKDIIIYALLAILGGFMLYYKGNAKINGKVSELIARAENEYKSTFHAGEIKFEWVVSQLYALIPPVVRPFVPRSLISALVQTTFDAVQGYAKLQLDRLVK